MSGAGGRHGAVRHHFVAAPPAHVIAPRPHLAEDRLRDSTEPISSVRPRAARSHGTQQHEERLISFEAETAGAQCMFYRCASIRDCSECCTAL